jgi:N6-adenosine-specific RNA methylase IME4
MMPADIKRDRMNTQAPLFDHEIAAIFPLLSDSELEVLSNDIKTNGLQEPVILFDGKILDGRNRYRACKLAGVEARTKKYEGNSPAAFVWSANFHRRHLTATQKATAAVVALSWFEKEAKKRQATSTGGTKPQLREKFPEGARGKASERAAELAGVNAHYVSDAKAILEAAPEEFEAMRRGEKTIIEVKRQLRKAHLLGAAAELPSGIFRVIYADPPWKYNDVRNLPGYADTAAEDDYPTQSIEDLCAFPVREIVAENAVLFLWATSPLLECSFRVINAWGFTYKASFVWDKIRHNVGHYNSVRHEFLLIGTRGQCTPDVPRLFDSVQSIERIGRHSEKPEEFRQIIDTLYPDGNRLELFRRGGIPKGWQAWGNEVGLGPNTFVDPRAFAELKPLSRGPSARAC